jgi:hypothetical protein
VSSAVTSTFDPDTVGVPNDSWLSFCEEQHVVHSPNTAGGNVYYQGGVEVTYSTHRLSFSTYWQGAAMPDVGRLAMLAWARWGGALSADPEIRQSVLRDLTGGVEVTT